MSMRLLTLALGTAATLMLTGCGVTPALESSELSGSGGAALMRKEGPALYYVVHLCASSSDDVEEVTIVDVQASEVTGSDAPVTFAVDWSPSGVDPASPEQQPVPASYEQAAGSSGTLKSCDSDPAEQVRLAILLPDVGPTEAVVARGLRIDYEIDGERATLRGDSAFGHCPDKQNKETTCDV